MVVREIDFDFGSMACCFERNIKSGNRGSGWWFQVERWPMEGEEFGEEDKFGSFSFSF